MDDAATLRLYRAQLLCSAVADHSKNEQTQLAILGERACLIGKIVGRRNKLLDTVRGALYGDRLYRLIDAIEKNYLTQPEYQDYYGCKQRQQRKELPSDAYLFCAAALEAA